MRRPPLLDATSTRMYAPETRRHIDDALAAGATMEAIVEEELAE